MRISPILFASSLLDLPAPTNGAANHYYNLGKKNETIWNTLIWKFFKTKKSIKTHNDIVNFYKKAVECEPTCAKLYSAVGIALAMDGKLDEAKEYLIKANDLQKNNSWIEANLAKCYHDMGDSQKATYWLARAENNNKSI